VALAHAPPLGYHQLAGRPTALQEARVEFDEQADRLPFHEPDEAAQTDAGATVLSGDVRIRHLQRVPLFAGFDETELRRVAEHSRIVESPAGTVVTQIGEPGESFFIIIDGTLAVRTPVGPGTELHPGDFFGEMSLLDGEPRSATVVAATDVRLLVVDRSHFWRLLDETPDLVRRILTILSRRVRRLEQTLQAILRRPTAT
jgi:CRP-like cAMP-binding protein